MVDGDGSGTRPREHRRLLEQLDGMVRSGRVTEHEAAALRAASDTEAFDDVLQGIRVRHASTRLTSAVEDGSMSQEEADGFLLRLKMGEHPRSLRAHLAQAVRPGRRPPPPPPAG